MWGPYNKDYNIWGSILGFPYFGKLPNRFSGVCYNILYELKGSGNLCTKGGYSNLCVERL